MVVSSVRCKDMGSTDMTLEYTWWPSVLMRGYDREECESMLFDEEDVMVPSSYGQCNLKVLGSSCGMREWHRLAVVMATTTSGPSASSWSRVAK